VKKRLYEFAHCRAGDKGNTSLLSLFALRDAEARLVEDVAALKLAVDGPRKERVEQARAQVAYREAEVALLEDNLARHTVRAPFAGYVVRTSTELGEQLAAGCLAQVQRDALLVAIGDLPPQRRTLLMRRQRPQRVAGARQLDFITWAP